ncbi:type II methionyl aminopeptidase [Candidatus Woesearchaeota archaeon]|nr:type II methionyl aminopeptidase [Candidatus Woesearchaeota archaeon]
MENIEDYRKAGKIAAQALEFAKSLVKPGISLLEVCEKTEEKIKELGGELAFPVQISLNDTAAHFCPDADDNIILKDQIISIDIGVHINGFIGDNAATVDLSNKHKDLVKASREALDNAISIIKPGITLGEIGKTIQDTITKYGFAPVRNLSGHGLDEYNIHTTPTIPNYDNKDTTILEQGTIIAIEPFASAGAGIIYESSNPTIFQLAGKKPVRSIITRQVLKEINSYNGLPFCRRHLVKKFGLPKTSFALRELKTLGILREYPPLIDKSHGLVSQAEHTILITKDGCEILTKA